MDMPILFVWSINAVDFFGFNLQNQNEKTQTDN